MSVSVSDLENPNRIKIVVNHKNEALYFSRSAIPNTEHSNQNNEHYPFLRHIGLYAYRANVLQTLTSLKQTMLEKTESLEQLRWMFYGFPIQVVNTDIETPNIDVPADVDKVLELL